MLNNMQRLYLYVLVPLALLVSIFLFIENPAATIIGLVTSLKIIFDT